MPLDDEFGDVEDTIRARGTGTHPSREWLALAVRADPLLAQSAIDRLQSAAYELVVEGESYRKRQKPHPGQIIPPNRRRRSS